MNNLFLIKKSVAILLTLLVLLPTAGSALAKDQRAASGSDVPAAPLVAPGPTDPAEMEAFMDEFFAGAMEEYHIAGAAVAAVKDGRLFFAKGYGYADIEKSVPVDPEETVFRIGSVGKTLTWTAVMQLVEQGKLDLEADVNTYLDFRSLDVLFTPELRARWIGAWDFFALFVISSVFNNFLSEEFLFRGVLLPKMGLGCEWFHLRTVSSPRAVGHTGQYPVRLVAGIHCQALPQQLVPHHPLFRASFLFWLFDPGPGPWACIKILAGSRHARSRSRQYLET